MTAFDIYSAIGSVNEDILEESEIMPKKKTVKMIPLMAAAACIAVMAAGVSYTLRSDNIEQAVEDMTAESSIAGTSTPSEFYETSGEGSDPVTEDIFTAHETAVSNSESTDDVTSPKETEGEQSSPVTKEGIIFPAYTATGTVTETSSDVTEKAPEEEEIAIVPKWEDMSDLERYTHLDYNENTYTITTEHFAESELTFLHNVRLYGFDLEGYAERYSDPCAICRINNINPDYMVAALTADGLYTGFQREQYYADDLSDYLDDTDFLSRMEINDVVAFEEGSGLSRREYTVNDLPYAVEKLLTCAPDAPMSVNPPHDIGYIFYGILHEGKWQMQVYESGYIYIGRFFFVGTEHTDEFIGYVTENAVNVETVTYGTASAGGNDIPE